MPDKKKKIRGDDPNLHARQPMKGERRMIIDGDEWGWRVGSSGHVVIVRPTGGKTIVSDFAISRCWEEDYSDQPAITPGVIEHYIRANLLPEYSAF